MFRTSRGCHACQASIRKVGASEIGKFIEYDKTSLDRGSSQIKIDDFSFCNMYLSFSSTTIKINDRYNYNKNYKFNQSHLTAL